MPRSKKKTFSPGSAGSSVIGEISALRVLFNQVKNDVEVPEVAVLRFIQRSNFISTSRAFWNFAYDLIVDILPKCTWEQSWIQWDECPWDTATVKDPDEFCRKFVDDVIGPGFDLVEFLRQYRDDARAPLDYHSDTIVVQRLARTYGDRCPITHFSDTPTARELARTYGDRLEGLAPSERAALLSGISQALSQGITVGELTHAYECPPWALTLVANEKDLASLAKAIANCL